MQSNEYAVGRDVHCILMSSEVSVQERNNYHVLKGAPVQDVLRAMLGPRCDENSEGHDKLTQKMQQLHDVDFAKSKMRIEMWTFKGDGTMLVSATSIFKYMYTGSRDHMARTQRRVFELCRIPHILIEVPGVRTTCNDTCVQCHVRARVSALFSSTDLYTVC